MSVYQTEIRFRTRGQGTFEITAEAEKALQNSELSNGNLTAFCSHTSCSLVLMENADPSARTDLEAYFDKLVPENLPYFTHTYEGTDDMPSHIKMALTRSSETIPFSDGRLLLGTWQGLFLWEHRRAPHSRQIVFSLIGE